MSDEENNVTKAPEPTPEPAPAPTPAPAMTPEERKAAKKARKLHPLIKLGLTLLPIIAIVIGALTFFQVLFQKKQVMEFGPALTSAIICLVLALAALILNIVLPKVMKKRVFVLSLLISIAATLACGAGTIGTVQNVKPQTVFDVNSKALTHEEVIAKLNRYKENKDSILTSAKYKDAKYYGGDSYYTPLLDKGKFPMGSGSSYGERIDKWETEQISAQQLVGWVDWNTGPDTNYGPSKEKTYNGTLEMSYHDNGDGLILRLHSVSKDSLGVIADEIDLTYYDEYGIETSIQWLNRYLAPEGEFKCETKRVNFFSDKEREAKNY